MRGNVLELPGDGVSYHRYADRLHTVRNEVTVRLVTDEAIEVGNYFLTPTVQLDLRSARRSEEDHGSLSLCQSEVHGERVARNRQVASLQSRRNVPVTPDGPRLKQLRERKYWTQEQLAKKAASANAPSVFAEITDDDIDNLFND